MADYRKADSIILYDDNTIINNRGIESAFHDDEIATVELSGFMLSRLAEFFAIKTAPAKKFNSTYSGRLDQEIFEISRRVKLYGSDFSDGEVDDVLARVEGPNLLSIKIVEKWKELDGVEETVIREVSYGGKFLVEWSKNPSA